MYKRLPRLVAAALIATLGGWIAAIPAAQAWDATYDFTATGSIYTYTGEGVKADQGEEHSISGSVTFRVLTVAPPDGAIKNDGYAVSQNGENNWVLIDFGAHDPTPFDSGSSDPEYAYWVINTQSDPDEQSQAGSKEYLQTDGSIVRGHHASLVRSAFGQDLSWNSDFNFHPKLGLHYNKLELANYSIDYSSMDSSGIAAHSGTHGHYHVNVWSLASIDLAPLADKLAALPGGRGLSVLISTVQAQYDAGDMAGACQMLTAFSSQARGLAHNQNFAEMAGDALLDAELIGKILECN